MKTLGLVAAASIPWSRFRVPVRRLSRILTLAWSVRRWLISSPTRLTTPSTLSSASAAGRSVVGCQACQRTVGFFCLARCGSRVRPTTSSPRASRASQRAEPIIPLAPVTRTRIRRVMLATVRLVAVLRRGGGAVAGRRVAAEDLVGAGLLREACDAGLPRLLHDRAGDAGCDITVEDGGDDVVLGEIVVGDDLGDPARGGELHLLRDPGCAGVQSASEDPREAEDVVDLVGIVGAAGGHDPDVWLGFLRHHLRRRIRHREDDRVVVHLVQRRRLDQAGAGDPDEQVAALDHLVRAARELFRVRVLGVPALDRGHPAVDVVESLRRDRPLAVAPYDLGDPRCLHHLRAGDSGGTETEHEYSEALDRLADDLERIEERRHHDDRGPVLVVMEDRDLEFLLEAVLDLETAGRRDVLEIDPAEGRR